MADRIEAFAVTITAGTAEASFSSETITFNDGIVRQVDVRVPSGPAGLMGFRVAYASVSVIPSTDGAWLVMDNEGWSYVIDNNPTGGQWQIEGYNTDIYDHTVYVRLHVDEIPKPAPAASSAVVIPLGS